MATPKSKSIDLLKEALLIKQDYVVDSIAK